MNRELYDLLTYLADVLLDCGWVDQARWFSRLRNDLKVASTAERREEILSRLDASLAGMGSFSDLPLVSQSGRWTRQQLRDIQWSLTEKIGTLVDDLRNKEGEPSKNMNPPVLRKKSIRPVPGSDRAIERRMTKGEDASGSDEDGRE